MQSLGCGIPRVVGDSNSLATQFLILEGLGEFCPTGARPISKIWGVNFHQRTSESQNSHKVATILQRYLTKYDGSTTDITKLSKNAANPEYHIQKYAATPFCWMTMVKTNEVSIDHVPSRFGLDKKFYIN